jgi:hypothetical protein
VVQTTVAACWRNRPLRTPAGLTLGASLQSAPVLILALALLLLAGCLPVVSQDAAPSQIIYVANGRDGTISRIDSRSNRPLGPPLPVGGAPWQLAAGPDGTILALSIGASRQEVTHLVWADGGWRSRAILLERDATARHLAANENGYAIVAYDVPVGRCRIALIDLYAGSVAQRHAVCGEGEQIVGLALGGDRAGPVAYAALWRRPIDAATCEQVDGSRIISLHLITGAILGSTRPVGVPGELAHSTADGAAQLHALRGEISSSPDYLEACPHMNHEEHYQAASRWNLLSLDPVTLEVERIYSLRQPARSPSVAPDGRHVFAPSWPGTIVHVDLHTGVARDFASLPDAIARLVTTDDRIYALNPLGDTISVLDRRTGRLRRPVVTGRGPIGIALGRAGPRS